MDLLDVKFQGPVGDLYNEILNYRGPKRIREIVFRGPAGTSKSRSILQMIALLALQVRGFRAVLCRYRRTDMTQSTLKEWELCFPPDFWGGVARTNRSVYEFDSDHGGTGAEVWAVGMDDPVKLYSTSADVAYVEEVNQHGITLSAWEEFHRGLRHWSFNQQFLLGSYNPSTPDAWVEKRCDLGLCERVLTTFENNPKYYDADKRRWTEVGVATIDNLSKLTGPRYKRLYLGIPCVAEGIFYPEYDPDMHLVDVKVERVAETREIFLSCPRWGIERSKVSWTMGAMDFGHDAPGVLQIWAVDEQRRAWMLHEFYMTGQLHEWWADRLIEMYREYDLLTVFADPSDKEAIAMLNYRIAIERGTGTSADVPGLVCKANNRKRGDRNGFEAVRSWLARRIDGIPAVLFNSTSLMHAPDEVRKNKGLPTCFNEEMANFIFWKKDDGTRIPDEPDPDSEDHSMDTVRYLLTGAYQMDLRAAPKEKLCPPGTIGSRPQWPGGLTWDEWAAEVRSGVRYEKNEDDLEVVEWN